MDHNLAVLIDYDNIAKGSRQEGVGEFDIRVVMRRLKDMGRVLVARAYCDWERWSRHRQRLAEQGVTMVELTATGHGDKNRGDIALVVDAMEMAYTRDYLDTFVILSGDSDFTPLVSRLKELNRRVIGIGTRGSTSRLIANVCDEFLFYDSLVRNAAEVRTRPERTPEEEEEDDDTGKLKPDVAFALLVETLHNHLRDDGGPVHASVLKTSMKRKLPTFNENDLGFHSFARFLERAAAEGAVTLSRDERAGGLKVELANGNAVTPPQRASEAPPPRKAAPRAAKPVDEALQVLREEGFDVGTYDERRLVLDAFVAGCAAREADGRRLAVQYLQGDLVQQGLNPDAVRGVLQSLGAAGMFMHPDGQPVRSPTAPIQAPTSADELNELVEERMLEILGAKRIRVGPLVRNALFARDTQPRVADATSTHAPEDSAGPDTAPVESETTVIQAVEPAPVVATDTGEGSSATKPKRAKVSRPSAKKPAPKSPRRRTRAGGDEGEKDTPG